jgi:methyltransferase (TIGR00027 family)
MFDEPDLAGVHRTALGAALMRGLHLLYDGEPKVLRDVYAISLGGWTEEQMLGARAVAGSTSAWVSRGRFAEDRLADARARGVRQYVILGAGLDSFALRQAETLGELIVFEVDDPPMQEWKRRRIEQLRLVPPSALRFVPCDFESRSIPSALADAAFMADEPALVSWLGVTQYLTQEAIAQTLRWVSHLAPGSEIVLTFVVPGPEADAERELHATRGTRFATFFTPEQMVAVLADAGLRADLVPPNHVEAAYFVDRDDGLHAPTLERLIVGRTA